MARGTRVAYEACLHVLANGLSATDSVHAQTILVDGSPRDVGEVCDTDVWRDVRFVMLQQEKRNIAWLVSTLHRDPRADTCQALRLDSREREHDTHET